MIRKVMPLVLIALLSAPAGAQPIVLEYKYKLDEVDTYSMSITTSMKTPGFREVPRRSMWTRP